MDETGKMKPVEETAVPLEDYTLGELEDDKALVRKIDWQILPLMFMTYFLQFLDKVALNVWQPWTLSATPRLCFYVSDCCLQYANVMGLQKDLKMKGDDFSWLATAFFIAYAVAEFPQGRHTPSPSPARFLRNPG